MSILCVGQIVFDILVQPLDDKILERDTTRVESIDFSNGGDALNVAVVCRKLGNKVGFCGKVGDDEKGSYLIQKMEGHGLSTEGVIVTPEASTSTAVALIRSAGERNFLFEGGATLSFEYDDINSDVVNQHDIVFIGGTFTMPKFDGLGARKLFKDAKHNGKITAMDVTHDSAGGWMKTIEPCLEYLDYFMPSEDQAREITGVDSVQEMAEILRRKNVKNVIIKMGAKGVYIKNDEMDQLFPPAAVDKVVDTTGAGDSFVGGFLTGINRGLSVEDCLGLGQAAAAKCICRVGSTAGLENIENTSLYKREEGDC